MKFYYFFRFTGGKAQSTANVVEGLATCLQFFDDINNNREGWQKYCILICNSPPNIIPVMENERYAGNSLEQLAATFCEVHVFIFDRLFFNFQLYFNLHTCRNCI